MKVYIYKIDLSMFRHTEYLRKFHAILNQSEDSIDVSFFATEAQDGKQAIERAQEYVRGLVGHWRSAAAIEDATWCLMPLGTADKINCDIASAGYGYYYSGIVSHDVHFHMSDPVTSVKVTGDLNIYED